MFRNDAEGSALCEVSQCTQVDAQHTTLLPALQCIMADSDMCSPVLLEVWLHSWHS